MKFALVLLAVFGLAQAMPTRSLKGDLDDFLALIPKEELKALYHKYENDDDIKRIVAYLKSEDFAAVMHIIANVEEVQDLVKYLESNGVPIIDFLNRLADRLGLPHWPGSFSARHVSFSARTWRDFLEEAKKLVPLDQIAALVIDKLANSPDFQALYEKIASVDYQKLHDNALSHPEIKDMIDRLSALGVDLKKVWDFVKSFFGWSYSTFSTYSLKDDLDDFLALIPKEELKALYHKYENDDDIKRIVAYLKSEDFAAVMHIIANVEEVQDLVKYLESNGVPIIDFLNRLADRLGLPHWPGSFSARHVSFSARTWRDFLEEAKKLVPLDKIAALVVDKLANSPDFQALYEKIASVDYQKLHDNALSHPEIKDMIDRLSALGVDLKKVWDFVKSFFGWSYSTFSTYSLKDDLDDFLALIPKEELKALYHKYENDDDIKRIVAYLKSEDFAAVMHIIANVEEVQDLVKYLESNGVPIIDFLNRLADRLGLPHWPGSFSARHVSFSARTWRDFLEEAKKLVPLDKIAALVVDKLANSPDFQALYEKIASVDYQKLHDNALSHPEIKDMIDRLSALGVDLKKVWDFVKSFFGWSYSTFSTYSLKDDLDDFLALIPKEELKALYHKYENDDDIKRIVAYLKSEDFAAVMHIIANVEEVQDLVKYLESNGVPIIDFLNRLADRLGLPHWPGSFSARHVSFSARTWRDFLEEAKKLVPLDQIAALVIDKLANSPDFQALYEKIASVDYQKLHDNALSHPEIKDMIDRLSALGVDLKKVWDFVKSFFGWSYSTFSTYSLKDDLDDFLALIPKEELKALYHKYENDDDIKRIVAYLKSEDFAAVMHIIANVEEVQDLVKYLESNGVPIIDFLNRLADRLGLPHWPGSFSARHVSFSARTWRDFLEEAKKLVPLDQIAALFIDKLANSPDFQALYEKIASVDYQKLHDNALSHPEIQDMLDRLTALGVDVKKAWDFVKSVFGWE